MHCSKYKYRNITQAHKRQAFFAMHKNDMMRLKHRQGWRLSCNLMKLKRAVVHLLHTGSIA